MKVHLLPSAPGNEPNQYLTTYLIDDEVAIDAGSLGLALEPIRQARIGHVLVTHSHADHMLSLPMFVNNALDHGAGVSIYGSSHTLDCLHRDVFNDRLWPDLTRLSSGGATPVKLEVLESLTPVTIGRLTVTPVEVHHAVPTLGFVVDDGTSAVAFSSDSGPTHALWRLASRLPHLRAVFMGAAFPDALLELAMVSGHLTPRLFGCEAAKLPREVRLVAVHLKPAYRARVERELAELGLDTLSVGIPGHDYVF